MARKNLESRKRYAREYYISKKENDPDWYFRWRRDSHLKSKYGITNEEYDSMLKAQDGKCAICGQPSKTKLLSVDHDHHTGKVRALLCHGCNIRVAALENALFEATLKYLEKYNG